MKGSGGSGGKPHGQRELVGLRRDVGIDPLKEPFVQFAAGRFELRRPYGPQPGEAHNANQRVAAQAPLPDLFGQAAVNQLAGQQHLRNAVLGRDESLYAQCVRQGFREDVRDTLLVPSNEDHVIQHREDRRVDDFPVTVRCVVFLKPDENPDQCQQ